MLQIAMNQPFCLHSFAGGGVVFSAELNGEDRGLACSLEFPQAQRCQKQSRPQSAKAKQCQGLALSGRGETRFNTKYPDIHATYFLARLVSTFPRPSRNHPAPSAPHKKQCFVFKRGVACRSLSPLLLLSALPPQLKSSA